VDSQRFCWWRCWGALPVSKASKYLFCPSCRALSTAATAAALPALGYTEAYLLVSASNAPALGLYLSFGFKPVLEGPDEEAQWRGIVAALRRLPYSTLQGPVSSTSTPAAPGPTKLETAEPLTQSPPVPSAAAAVAADHWVAAVKARAEVVAADPVAFLVEVRLRILAVGACARGACLEPACIFVSPRQHRSPGQASTSFALCGPAAIVYSAAVLFPAEAFVAWAMSALTTGASSGGAVGARRSHAAVAANQRFEAKQREQRCRNDAHRLAASEQCPTSSSPAAIVDHALCWALAEAMRATDPALFAAQMVRACS